MAGVPARDRAGRRAEWRTVRGSMSGARLDAVCARIGVEVGRRTRRRWQRLGLFPLPVRPGSRCAPSAAYHHRAPLLAVFLHGTLGPDPACAAPDAIRQARDTIALLRLRAVHLNGSLAGEDRFYALLGELVRGQPRQRVAGVDPSATAPVAPRPARAPTYASPPRWTTTRGTLTAVELEAACRAQGARMDRARRTYWQSERAFPQPERRRLRPPEGNGGARGYYHAGAVALAVVVDYAARHDHPSKVRPWRCTVADVAEALAGWRADARDEDGFYRRVEELLPLVAAGDPLPGLASRHRDVLPAACPRIADGERQEVLTATGRAVAALADAWVAGHADEPAPDRLVVWLRVERAGPGEWRISDAGARPTSHERQRRAARTRGGAPGELMPPERPLAFS